MKKMKVILVLLAIVTAIPFFSGCKKGENDPFLSFRSRDARLMGDWKLSKIEETEITDTKANTVNLSTGATYTNTLRTQTTTFDGSSITSIDKKDYSGTAVVSGSTTNETKTNVYTTSIELTIAEHGVVKVTETMTWKSQTLSTTPADVCSVGYTAGLYCDGTYTETTPTTTTNTYEGTWNWGTGKKNKEMLILSGIGSMDGVYLVNQLKNKEIVLTQNYVDNYVNSGDSNNSVSSSLKSTATLTAK